MGWIKKKWPAIAGPVLYGVAGFVAVEIVVFCVVAISVIGGQPQPPQQATTANLDLKSLEGQVTSLSQYVHDNLSARQTPNLRPRINPETLERTVRQWLGSVGYGFVPDPPNAAVFFSLTVTMPSGRRITVRRERDDRYSRMLEIGFTMLMDAPFQATLTALTPEQQRRLFHDIEIEISKLHADSTAANLQQGIAFAHFIPISDLSEDSFIHLLDDTDSQALTIRETILRDLNQ